MLFIGIDPGANGGIAMIAPNNGEPTGNSSAFKMPETEKDTYSLICNLTYTEICRLDVETFALIEKVHSMPKQGVASTFKFGMNYGLLRGILIALQIPFDEVTPQKWQKAMGCLTHGDKNISKAKAQQLFPQLKITHATADALLIAEHCRRTYGREAKS